MTQPFPSAGFALSRLTWRKVASLAAGSALALPLYLPPSARAQTSAPQPASPAEAVPSAEAAAPTVRYARGEDVPLSDIVSEWRGYYEDVPVYLCVCQDDTCDQTEQWPYREYSRFQLGVALGPTNGRIAEDSGANCFDIADNSRPSAPRAFSAAQTGETASEGEAASEPETPPENAALPAEGAIQTPPESADAVPPTAPGASVAPERPAQTSPAPDTLIATAIEGGESLRLSWPSGETNDIAIAGSDWNINIVDALDCASTSVVDAKAMSAQRVVGEVAVDSETGNIAIPVLLDSCLETDQSAVFILDPSEGGGYSLYRTQLPGTRNFPNEFSSYAFSSILDVSYGKGLLYVQQGTASGAESVVVFRAGTTPAGTYAGCTTVNNSEGADRLCPASSATPF